MENIKENEVQGATISEFESKSITSLFWKYSLFAFAGLLFQAVQVIMDGSFVGNGIGPNGLAVISVTGVFWQVAVAMFNLFGVGGSTLAAIKLGNGDPKGAKEVYTSIMMFGLAAAIVLSVVAYFNLDSLLILFGATPEIMDGAIQYSTVFLIGLPFCVLSSIAYFFTRVAEKPLAASVAYSVPAVIAIILEYIAIFKLHFGVGSSSFAGEVCAGLGFLLIPYLNIKNTVFKIKLSDLKINLKVVWQCMKIGCAMFIIPLSAVGFMIVTNNMLIKTGGSELHLASYGIIGAYIIYVLNIFTVAFITGLAPIASYNYGAKMFNRVKEVIRVGIVQSTVAMIVIVVLVWIFAEQVITFFIGPDPVLLPIAKGAMRIVICMYAFGNISQMTSGYFMAVERSGLAIINAVLRMVVFAIPIIFIMSSIYGTTGVWMGEPIADTMAAIVAVICLVFEYKRLKKIEGSPLPDNN